MKVLPRAKWLDLWHRTGARAFKRAAIHQPAAVAMVRPEVLCDRDVVTARLPRVLRLALGVSPTNQTSPAAGLCGARAAGVPQRGVSKPIVAPARFFKAVKRGLA